MIDKPISSSSLSSLSSASSQSLQSSYAEHAPSSASASTSRASSSTPTDLDPLLSATTVSRSRRKTRSAPITHAPSASAPAYLDIEYARAYADLRAATIYALYRLGYTNPKRRSPSSGIPTLPMVLAAKFPDVERARRRVNEVDQKMQIWESAPWAAAEMFDEPEEEGDGQLERGEEGDEEEDKDEKEIRAIWARFVERERLTASKSEGAAGSAKRKRKQAVPDSSGSQETYQSDRQLRRRVAVDRSLTVSGGATTTGSRKRVGLRSSNGKFSRAHE